MLKKGEWGDFSIKHIPLFVSEIITEKAASTRHQGVC